MRKKTKRTSATVKVMLSYNYNHFEASIELQNSDGICTDEINNARKDCNRLCDTAIQQYQQAKLVESKRANLRSERSQLEQEVRQLKQKDEKFWTVTEKAKVKALADHNWDLSWNYDDDFNEDDFR